jgi:REP element-mobilizing transposase RayT
VLGGAAELRLKQIIGEVVTEFGGMVIEVETMPDHVLSLDILSAPDRCRGG